MVDKRGKWNVGDAFSLDNAAIDMIDDKLARNMANDIRRQLGPNALQPHKPLISGPGVGPGGIPISSGRRNLHGAAAAGSPMRSGLGGGPQAGSKGSLHNASKDFAIANRSPAARSGSKDGDLLSSMA